MKVCFFTENYYKGGLDTFIINLINNWPLCDDIFLICNKSHNGVETITRNTSRAYNIILYNYFFTRNINKNKKNNSFFTIYKYLFLISFKILEYPILLPYYFISLLIFFKKNNYDKIIIINGGYPASLLCRVAALSWYFYKKEKVIFNFHNNIQKPNLYNFLFEHLIDYFVCKSTKSFVTVSQNTLDSARNRFFLKMHHNKFYIYNGIDTQYNYLSNPSKIDYCLMLATYEKRKGHEFLLKSFQNVVKLHPQMILKIFGDGSEKEIDYVKKLICKYGLSENVYTYNFTDKKFELLKNCKLLLVPSQSFESFGLTIIEAMSLGIPVVATNVGGIKEVLTTSEAGFVCEYSDFIDFASKINLLLSDNKLYSYMSENGKIYYSQNYTAKKMTEKYYNILNKN